MADEVKENNKQLVCEIKIDAEMMRKIIDEKMTQIELDIQGIRAKAIDEFASTLIPRLTDAIYQKDVESMTNLINEIAEHLKAGGENE